MQVHLVDGTYELFRYHYAPTNKDPLSGATRGVVSSCLALLEKGATHVAVATDHVIESFRNDLWPTYKHGSGVDPQLKAKFPIVEDALQAFGFTVWAMVEQEADDALAAGALTAAADDRVGRVVICTPDKDLGQCVGGKVWQWDRRQDTWFDAAGVHARLGVPPTSVPDLLALVGDTADGFPVRTDAEVGSVDEWRWAGPIDAAGAVAKGLNAPRLLERAEQVAVRLGA